MSSRATYLHELRHYTDFYGVSLRTICRWAKKGFPLDDEPRTRALVAGQRSTPRSTAQTAAGAVATSGGAALGLSASIQRLQEAEAAAHAEYAAALSSDPILAAGKLRNWTALAEQLRKTELATPEVQEANKAAVSLSDLQATLNELFVSLRQDLDTLPRRIALELVGKDEIAIRDVLSREVGEVVSALYQCKYLGAGGG